jgi:hypothetical protein
MKLFFVIITAICCALYGYQWYLGQMVPAWAALIWCASVFLHELRDYLENK